MPADALSYEMIVNDPHVTSDMLDAYTRLSAERWKTADITPLCSYSSLTEDQLNDLYLMFYVHPHKLSNYALRVWFNRCPIDPDDEYRWA